MPDELVREEDPFIFRDNSQQVLLNLFRVGLAREVQARGQTLHVRIDDDARRDSECRARKYHDHQ